MASTGSRAYQPSPDRPRPEEGRAAGGHERYKTSAAAAFALVFGISALVCGLTAILFYGAIVLGIIGIILGIVGIKMAGRPHVTGKGVAVGGLVTAVLGLLLGLAVPIGVVTVLNNSQAVHRINKQVQKLENKLPSQVPTPK